jgi:hypothetical protein
VEGGVDITRLLLPVGVRGRREGTLTLYTIDKITIK